MPARPDLSCAAPGPETTTNWPSRFHLPLRGPNPQPPIYKMASPRKPSNSIRSAFWDPNSPNPIRCRPSASNAGQRRGGLRPHLFRDAQNRFRVLDPIRRARRAPHQQPAALPARRFAPVLLSRRRLYRFIGRGDQERYRLCQEVRFQLICASTSRSMITGLLLGRLKWACCSWLDFPNFGEGGDTPLGRPRFEAMMREGIERDFNHHSIFAWCLFNETWGFGGQDHVRGQASAASARSPAGFERSGPHHVVKKSSQIPAQEWVQHMWELAKKTRLHASGRGHEAFALGTLGILTCICDTDINVLHLLHQRTTRKAKAHISRKS